MKEGYKKTELGWIPEEWNISSLSDIAEINPKKDVLDNEKEVSFIAMEHISNSGRVVNMEARNYGNVSKGYTAFKNEDVLLAKITPCFENGKKAIVKNLKNGYGFGSTEFHVLRSKDQRSIPEFLYYYVSTNKFRQQAELNMTGSAGQKRVPTTFLNNNRLVVPSLKEQQKIAEILSTVDSQIDDTDKLIEKAKELKKGLMQRLLTKGIGHIEFKMTEIGEIPVEWEVNNLSEIIDICYGKSQKEVKVSNGKYKILGTGGVIGYTNNFLWDKPSVLIGRKGTIDKPQYIEEPFWTVDTLFYTKIKDNDLAKWLFYYLSNIDLKKYNEATGVPSLSVSNLNFIKVAVPSLKEQRKIVEVLSSVDIQIKEYENKRAKLEELKKGLMQQLLTGKIRVV